MSLIEDGELDFSECLGVLIVWIVLKCASKVAVKVKFRGNWRFFEEGGKPTNAEFIKFKTNFMYTVSYIF